MPPHLSFRPAAPEDDAFLYRLYASTRADISALPLAPQEKETVLRMQFAAQHEQYRASFPDASFAIVEVDGVLGGRLYVDRGSDEYRVIDISLLPEYRGRGVGTELMRGILDEAQRISTPVRLHVEHANPARRLYERLGFVESSATDTGSFMEWTPPARGGQLPGGRTR